MLLSEQQAVHWFRSREDCYISPEARREFNPTIFLVSNLVLHTVYFVTGMVGQ